MGFQHGDWQKGGKRYHHTMQPPFFSTACGFLVCGVSLESFKGKKYFFGWCWKSCPTGHGIIGPTTWHIDGSPTDEGDPYLKIDEHLKAMIK